MVNYNCNLCTKVFESQFDFFSHLKSHYEPKSNVNRDVSMKIEYGMSDSALLEQFLGSEADTEVVVETEPMAEMTSLISVTNRESGHHDSFPDLNDVSTAPDDSVAVSEETITLAEIKRSLKNKGIKKEVECNTDQVTNHEQIDEEQDVEKAITSEKENNTNVEEKTPRRSRRKPAKKEIRNIKRGSLETGDASETLDKPNNENGEDVNDTNEDLSESNDPDYFMDDEYFDDETKDSVDLKGGRKSSTSGQKKKKTAKAKVTTVIEDGKVFFKCDQCERKFTHRSSFDYHKRWHTGEKKFICEVCKKAFLSSTLLKVHTRIHTDERPFKCKMCDKAFRQWSDLKYHFDSLHSNEKNYQCEFCGKGFARNYSLIIHRRIHTGERNYKCDVCDKTFRASCYLLMHRMIHTGEKRYSCDICKKPFRLNSDMKRHRETHSTNRKKTPRKQAGAAVNEEMLQTIFKIEPCVPDLDDLNDDDFDETSNTFVITPVVIKVINQ